MNEYYSRQIMLWKEQTQDSLKDKKIAIIGAGGLGCSVALALSGSGVGEIDIVDFDTIELHNIHRQLGFTTSDLDRPKAEVLSDLINQRNPHIYSTPFIEDFNTYKQNATSLDLIIDATDNLQSRADIDNFAKEIGTPWIYGAVEEFGGYVCMFNKSSFSAFIKDKKDPVGIAAPMVMQVASLQANLALRYLAGLNAKSDLFYMLSYNKDGEFEVKRFSA